MFKKQIYSFYLMSFLFSINLIGSQGSENKENIRNLPTPTDIQKVNNNIGQYVRLRITIQRIERLTSYLRGLNLTEGRPVWTNALNSLDESNFYQISGRRRDRGQ